MTGWRAGQAIEAARSICELGVPADGVRQAGIWWCLVKVLRPVGGRMLSLTVVRTVLLPWTTAAQPC